MSTAPQRKTANSKKRGREPADNSNEKNELYDLVYFLLAGGTDLRLIGSIWCKKLFIKGDSNLQLPTTAFFVDTIVQNACTELQNTLIRPGFFSILLIYTQVVDNNIFAISFALTQQYKLVYLYDIKFSKDLDKENNFREFCAESVEQFRTKDGHIAKYVIYNGNIFLEDVGRGLAKIHFNVKCFSTILKDLKNNHDGWHLNPDSENEDFQTACNYKKKLIV